MLLFALPISNSTPHRDASQSRSNKRRGFTPYMKRAKVKHSSSSESISPANQLQVVLSLHRGPCHVFSVLADPFSLPLGSMVDAGLRSTTCCCDRVAFPSPSG
jgi:hypothetical protein